jgi:DUF1680 family protein
LEDGTGLKITQKTNYPWDGRVDLAVTPAQPSEFMVYLRIPGWADSAEVSVNGKPMTGVAAGKYLSIRRRWSAGDAIRLQIPMPTQMLSANPRVADDTGRVAVQRGPLVYCLEGVDQPQEVELSEVALRAGKPAGDGFQTELRKDLLDGIVVLRHPGLVRENATGNVLYPRYTGESVKIRHVDVTFIPYYAWSNRMATAMQVWTPLLES